jgi:hypothetical protein
MIKDLLKIPDFLRRKKRRGRPRKIEDTPVEVNPHIEWDKIKQERYGTKYNIILGHGFPRIGSGNRIIYVSEKRKWVHIVSHSGNPYTTQPIRTKILKSKWNDIKKSHERYLKRNGVKVI